VTQQLRELPPLVYLGEVAELAAIEVAEAGLTIGAAVSLTDAWRAIVERYPAFAELARRFASPPVCNSGSLVGNLANGSPIGDAMPVLLALDASLRLQRGDSVRELPLERFYLGYRQTDLQPGEFVSHVRVPMPREGWRHAAYKLSKRFDQDISAVCLGIAVCIDDDNTVTAARLGFGGMAAIPARARRAEAALVGEPWCETRVEAAVAALAVDFAPLTDLRASGRYRLQAAGNLLRRFWLEQAAHGRARVTRTLQAVG
jgi:xanthine dehydrogenase small subunit